MPCLLYISSVKDPQREGGNIFVVVEKSGLLDKDLVFVGSHVTSVSVSHL